MFDPPVELAWVGDTIDLYVAIDTGIANASFFRTKIQFDTTLMRVDTIVPSNDWLTAAGSSFNQFFSYKDSLDPDVGEWYFDIFGSLAAGRTIDGYSQLAKITFILEAGGETDLHFFFTRLEDPNLNVIPAWALDGRLTICPLGYTTGDVNNDGTIANPVDLSYLVEYFFNGGPPPQPDNRSADLNCDATVDPVDLAYLVDYLFAGGQQPCDICQVP